MAMEDEMMTMYPNLPYVKLSDGPYDPRYAKEGDAGLDLCSMEDVQIMPQGMVMVGTGIAVAIPEGFCGLVLPRSGMATKRGITIINTPGLIDSGYRGEVKLPLYNASTEPQEVLRGERVAQMVVIPFASVNPIETAVLPESERGEGGFGSTGVRERL